MIVTCIGELSNITVSTDLGVGRRHSLNITGIIESNSMTTSNLVEFDIPGENSRLELQWYPHYSYYCKQWHYSMVGLIAMK